MYKQIGLSKDGFQETIFLYNSYHYKMSIWLHRPICDLLTTRTPLIIRPIAAAPVSLLEQDSSPHREAKLWIVGLSATAVMNRRSWSEKQQMWSMRRPVWMCNGNFVKVFWLIFKSLAGEADTIIVVLRFHEIHLIIITSFYSTACAVLLLLWQRVTALTWTGCRITVATNFCHTSELFTW